MVRLENGIATLRPIAGTRPRGKTEKEDRALANELLTDEKEKAEHLMLVDLGRNDLGRVAETGTRTGNGSDDHRTLFACHAHGVQHRLRPQGGSERLGSAEGRISGRNPDRRTQGAGHGDDFQFETEPRGPYGGAVGYISFNGNMDLAITIRTACIEKDCLTVRAGAGIVADSDPDKEYARNRQQGHGHPKGPGVVTRIGLKDPRDENIPASKSKIHFEETRNAILSKDHKRRMDHDRYDRQL